MTKAAFAYELIFNNLNQRYVIVDAVSGNNLDQKPCRRRWIRTQHPGNYFELNENVFDRHGCRQHLRHGCRTRGQINALLAADANLTYSEMTGKFTKTVNSLTIVFRENGSGKHHACRSQRPAGHHPVRRRRNEIVQNHPAQLPARQRPACATDQTVMKGPALRRRNGCRPVLAGG